MKFKTLISIIILGLAISVPVVADAEDPKISSITRHNPADEYTGASSATLRVTFSEPVVNVSSEDFVFSGSAASAIAQLGSSQWSTVSSSIYDLTVTPYDGEFYLAINGGNDIEDLEGDPLDKSIGTNEHYFFEVLPEISLDDVSKTSVDPVTQAFFVRDDSGITANNIQIDPSSSATTTDFSCKQVSLNDQVNLQVVDCTVNINSSGGVIIKATDDEGNEAEFYTGQYWIGDDAKLIDDTEDEIDIPRPDLGFSGKLKNLRLSSKKKIYIKKDEVKFKGTIKDLAEGKVLIKYKRGSKSKEKEVDIDSEGNWSKKIKFKKDGNYKIKFTFYNKNEIEIGSRGYYKVKIDTEDPVIGDMPARLTKRVGDKVWWSATDNEEVDKYKYYFNGKKYKTKDPFFFIPGGTPPGEHELQIRAYDDAKNKDVKFVTIVVR